MTTVSDILLRHPNEPGSLLDILRDIRSETGAIGPDAAAAVAARLGLSRAEVEGVASFYHFTAGAPLGRNAVYLNTSVTAVMAGREAVAEALEAAAGCRFGETSPDGAVTLLETSCIGMNDQEPAALVNGTVVTRMTPERARALVAGLRAGKPASELAGPPGDGTNASPRVRSAVVNNIRREGPVLFGDFQTGSAVRKCASMTPEAVIQEVKGANLLGRGGAGFPTGLKWEFCRREADPRRYVVANGDEGEPGTFKDRVLLTERAALVFEGMAVAGYAVGAREGIFYLRAEYAYLRRHLEGVLESLRKAGVLGRSIAGREGFDFDVRIVSGAGAYVCGEESALLNSAEGKRGDPRDRPPFPVQAGYRDCPTTVNNPETLVCAAQILARGAAWFKTMGTAKSAGTKLLSVSGDVARPGVYEVEFGLTVSDLLEMAGAKDTAAVQVGGPSGTCLPPESFGRRICFGDVPTGGSVIVFDKTRDLLAVVRNFLEFFVEESCGWCVPCRAGNPLLLRKLDKIMAGKGTAGDLEDIEAWGKMIRAASRCGLGQTSPNPLLATIQNFRPLYQERLRREAFVPEFDLAEAEKAGRAAAGRPEAQEARHE